MTLEGGVPADLALPGLLVEPTTFFGLTGGERINAVFSACDMKEAGDQARTSAGEIMEVRGDPGEAG